MLPKWVHDAGEILKGNVGRYIFISTHIGLRHGLKSGSDESALLGKYEGTIR